MPPGETVDGASASVPIASRVARDAFRPDFDAMFDCRGSRSRRVLRGGHPPSTSRRRPRVMRQAFAGLLWSKQFYHYVVSDWLEGDRAQPAPPAERLAAATTTGRISTTPTSSRCRTSGSTRGTRRGTWRSTACRWRSSTPTSRRSSSSAAARVVHAPQRPAARVRVGLRRRQPAGPRLGRAGASTRSTRSAAAPATARSSSASSTSCCSTSPGG